VDTDATYRVSGEEYTYDELVDALNAEAATLPEETWRGGWKVNDHVMEAVLVGIIETVDTDG
jgi:hypothetical protein